MLKIGTIGVGNAGCQVADLAKAMADIDGLAINSSDNDLANVKNITKLKIGDTFGAGKDRDEAKKFVKKSINEFLALEDVNDFLSDKQVVFIITSIDGGTGSGTTPVLTDILNTYYNVKGSEHVLFVLVPIYPKQSESPAAMQNALDFLTEVDKYIPTIPRLSFDNNKLAHLSSNMMIETVNKDIVEKMKIIRGDYNYSTPYASIDEKDMLRLINVPGEINIFNYSEFSTVDLESKSIEEELLRQVKGESLQVSIERDKIVKKMGVISNLDTDVNGKFDSSLKSIKEFTGNALEGFEHTYINPDDGTGVNRVCLIMSGLSIPDTRIKTIVDYIETAAKEMNKVKKSSVLASVDTSGIAALRASSTNSSNNDEVEETGALKTEDILAKYL